MLAPCILRHVLYATQEPNPIHERFQVASLVRQPALKLAGQFAPQPLSGGLLRFRFRGFAKV